METYERFEQLRNEKELTQNELANSLGIDRSVYNKIETGIRPVRERELVAIAELFGVSTDYLLGRSTQKYSKHSAQEEKDVAKQLENIINQIENEDSIRFYDRTLSSEDCRLLANILKMGLYLSKDEFKSNH